MKKLFVAPTIILSLFFSLVISSCSERKTTPAKEMISELQLKRGALITCGASDQKFGQLDFETACDATQKENFNLAVKLLHSFEYDEAEKVFAKIIDAAPGCAMAYWGVAMSNFHPLWTPSTPAELKKGTKAIEIARGLSNQTEKEKAYLNAIAAFYDDWEKTDHRTRCLRFEKAMEKLYAANPGEKETAIFYALSLTAAADKADKTYTKQKKAGAILTTLYAGQPDHPGIVHYIIHTYDVPELATLALPAARKYATVAPSSAHALHMPSHIFTRLGLWDEDIQSNLVSVSAAKCYAAEAGINGHWDEELHGLDYLEYAYLQQGDNDKAKTQLNYLATIIHVEPINFKVAYAFAAMPSRYYVENRMWKEAANLEAAHANFAWENFPWQKAVFVYTRFLGAINLENFVQAKQELTELRRLYELLKVKDPYQANQVLIQVRSAEAWIKFKQGDRAAGLKQMQAAADMEDNTGKHPVTPCEIVPQRELLGEMLMQSKDPANALIAYETNLENNPGRFNGIYGAGLASEQSGDTAKAKLYYAKLLELAGTGVITRPEIKMVKTYLQTH
ncbi:MAG: hypothetical protein V4725_17090 [Bacteroidota bacterium]